MARLLKKKRKRGIQGYTRPRVQSSPIRSRATRLPHVTAISDLVRPHTHLRGHPLSPVLAQATVPHGRCAGDPLGVPVALVGPGLMTACRIMAWPETGSAAGIQPLGGNACRICSLLLDWPCKIDVAGPLAVQRKARCVCSGPGALRHFFFEIGVFATFMRGDGRWSWR